MAETQFDVLGIGNAIVDVMAQVDDGFLSVNQIVKGGMTLIDRPRTLDLLARMGTTQEISGGSAANTMAGLACLGGRAAYIGKVHGDHLGHAFARDINAVGVTYRTPPATAGNPTACCLILVTPDGERSMNTFLGASIELGPEDIDAELVQGAKVVYLEGYLWDPPRAKDAFLEAARIARSAGRTLALSLSDSFCVDRHRQEFLELIDNHVDLLFANEAELKGLFRTDDFDRALAEIRGRTGLAAVTRGAAGAVAVTADGVASVPAEPVERVVDTTGAGDLFAAGFLRGYTQGLGLDACLQMGAIAAAEVISHVGARPVADLPALMAARNL